METDVTTIEKYKTDPFARDFLEHSFFEELSTRPDELPVAKPLLKREHPLELVLRQSISFKLLHY